MHTGKVINIRDIPDKESYNKLLEERSNKEALGAAQEIIDQFAMYLKYRGIYDSGFLYQLRDSKAAVPLKVKELVREALEPLGWHVSYYWSSTNLTYDFTIT